MAAVANGQVDGPRSTGRAPGEGIAARPDDLDGLVSLGLDRIAGSSA